MELNAGDIVRLTEPATGMPVGSEGVLLGWYVHTSEALVNFWDGGPLRVPECSVERVDES